MRGYAAELDLKTVYSIDNIFRLPRCRDAVTSHLLYLMRRHDGKGAHSWVRRSGQRDQHPRPVLHVTLRAGNRNLKLRPMPAPGESDTKGKRHARSASETAVYLSCVFLAFVKAAAGRGRAPGRATEFNRSFLR